MDRIDSHCHGWIDGRKCITLPGGECHNQIIDENSSYLLNVLNGQVQLDCSLNQDGSCERAMCEVDIHWARHIASDINELHELGSSFVAVVGDENSCPFCQGTCFPPTRCVGLAPDLRSVHD